MTGESAVASFDQLLSGYRAAASYVSELVRRSERTTDLTPGGQWTVRETAAHLIGFTKLYTRLLAGEPSLLARFDDLGIVNSAFFVAIDEQDPFALADLLASVAERYVERAAELPAAQPRPYHAGLTFSVAQQVTVLCNELLMHGWDVATATKQPTRPSTGVAAITLDALAPFLAPFIPAGPIVEDVLVEIRPNDAASFFYQLASTGVTRPSSPHFGAPDCTVSGLSFDILLWLSGRTRWEVARLDAVGSKASQAPTFFAR